MITSSMKTHKQCTNYLLAQVIKIQKNHEDEAIDNAKSIVDVGPLALVANEEIVNENKSNLIVDDSDSDATNYKLTREMKAFLVSNPMKFFKRISQSLETTTL